MFKKTFSKQPYLTPSDVQRIKRMSENEQTESQKFKATVIYNVKGCKQDFCITVYGKSKEDLLANADEHLQNFKSKDKNWKISKIEWLKLEITEDDYHSLI